MQVAQLEAEKLDYVKDIQFPKYVGAPKPTSIDDLQNLANSLGSFNKNLSGAVTSALKFEGMLRDDAQKHAEAIALQGAQFGPFADYAELTKLLEKTKADASLTDARREQASVLLNDIRARGNRIKPFLTSEARVMGVRGRTYSLNEAALANPVIGQDEDGSDINLMDVSADHPLWTQWANGHIYGDTVLTSRENQKAKGYISTALMNTATSHNARKVKHDEQQAIAQTRNDMRELGRQHARATSGATNMNIVQPALVEQLQELIDRHNTLSMSDTTREEFNKDLWNYYANGFTAEQKGEDGLGQVDVTTAVNMFKQLYVGPAKDRQLKDGSPNKALLWINTQDEDWERNAEYDLLNADADRAKNMRKIQAEQLLQTIAPDLQEIEDAYNMLGPDGKVDIASRRRAEQQRNELERRLIQENHNPVVVKQVLKELDGSMDAVDEALYGSQLDDGRREVIALSAQLSAGLITFPQFMSRYKELKEQGRLRDTDIKTFDKTVVGQTTKDNTLQRIAQAVKIQTDKLDKDLAALVKAGISVEDQTYLDKEAVRADLVRQQGELIKSYLFDGLDPDEALQQAQLIKPDLVQSERALGTETAEEYDSLYSRVEPRGTVQEQMSYFKNQLIRGDGTMPGRQAELIRLHREPRPIFNNEMAVGLAEAAIKGMPKSSKGYDLEAIKKFLPDNVDVNQFLADELDKNAENIGRSTDPEAAAKAQKLKQIADRLRNLTPPQKVSYIQPTVARQFADLASNGIGKMLDLVLGVGPAQAQLMGVPGEYRYAPKPGRQGIPEMLKTALAAGFTPEEAVIAAAIGMAESSGDPSAHNPNRSTGDNSFGIWQINMLDGMGPERRKQFGIGRNEELFNPVVNAKAARQIYMSQGWGAWSVTRPYKGEPARYLQYLPEARKALQTVLNAQ